LQKISEFWVSGQRRLNYVTVGYFWRRLKLGLLNFEKRRIWSDGRPSSGRVWKVWNGKIL